MSAMSGELVAAAEITAFVEWVMLLTGYRVCPDPTLGRTGVEIDHDTCTISVNSSLSPPEYRWALSRACRRIVRGADATPEFRTKLHLVVD